MKKARQSKLQLFLTLLMLGLCAVPIAAQTTTFTYQGKLTEAGNLANGSYDMQFKLFDTVTVGTGTQQGATLTNPTVQVTVGIFAVNLDFGTNVFTGAARFLEISVRPAGSANPYTVLAPRQPITSSPYAIQTVNAQQLGGLPANRYIATDANGNVGIGTPSPTTRLDVVNSTSQLRFGPTAADNGGYLISTNPSQAIIAGGARWDGANWIARDTAASLTAHQNGVVQFLTNSNLSVGTPFDPTLRMHIDVSGNVGIGTSTPEQRLHVHSGKILTAGSDAAFTFRNRESANADGDWALYATGGIARLYNNSFGDVLTVTTNGNVGIGTSTPNAKLNLVSDGITGVYATSITNTGVYGESISGFGVYGRSRDHIAVYGQSSNNIGVYGYTANSASYAGYFNGNVFVDGTVTQGSDARLKQNIHTLGYGLSEVLRLRPVTWRWKEHPESGQQLGLVAQEVESVLPELVSTDKDAEQIKGINYTGLLPVLIKSIQQQQARIEQQSRQLKKQQTQLERQQREIGELRQAVKARKSSTYNQRRK